MRSIVRSAAVLFVVMGIAGVAEAKDLTGRVGVGYEDTLVAGPGESLSGISARFYPTQQLFVGGVLGFQSVDPDAEGADTQTSFGLGANAGYVFVDEPNLNLYGGAGLSFGSVSVTEGADTEGKTALGLNVGVGMEFFFVGLPNLGFTAFYGMSYASVDDLGSSLSLGGDDFGTYGIRYYFGGPTGPDSP
jgi:hypothetical protein